MPFTSTRCACCSGSTAKQWSPWLARLGRSSKLPPTEISAVGPGTIQNGRWTIPKGVAVAQLDIAPSADKRTIRQVKLGVETGGPFQVQFTPRPHPTKPGKFADAEASPLKINKIEAGKPAMQLTILQHGGSLIATRLGGLDAAVLKVE